MENKDQEFARPRTRNVEEIPGWGVDADPKNDPTYPMKKRTNAEHKGYTWERPDQQTTDLEILHSNERPNLTAVFGTSSPPSGLSGMLRRVAFRFSENSYGHWVPLLLADRVNMVEGVVDDLNRGHVPNVFAEMGWGADWKYDRKGFLTKCVVAGALTATAVACLSRSSKKRRRPSPRRRQSSRVQRR